MDICGFNTNEEWYVDLLIYLLKDGSAIWNVPISCGLSVSCLVEVVVVVVEEHDTKENNKNSTIMVLMFIRGSLCLVFV
jgi:hypothetical protein